MSEETEKKNKHTYTIYMIDGKTQTVLADEMVLNHHENRVSFVGMDESEGEWVFFISGIASIHKQSQRESKPEQPESEIESEQTKPKKPKTEGQVRVTGRILG